MSVEDVNADSWEDKVMRSELPVVVHFWALGCGFCNLLAPTYKNLAKEYEGKMVFLKMDVDDKRNRELLRYMSIEATPTLKFYYRGREVDEHMGFVPGTTLVNKIKTVLEEKEIRVKNSTPIKKS